jgi:hypothetical protein
MKTIMQAVVKAVMKAPAAEKVAVYEAILAYQQTYKRSYLGLNKHFRELLDDLQEVSDPSWD